MIYQSAALTQLRIFLLLSAKTRNSKNKKRQDLANRNHPKLAVWSELREKAELC